jgi:uncharacterized protein with von Willebrand factor type A (vWA) domain
LKPECELCEEKGGIGLELDQKTIKELLYQLFNPREAEREPEPIDVASLIAKRLPGGEQQRSRVEDYFDILSKAITETAPINFGVVFRYKDFLPAQEEVWKDLQQSGQLQRLSARQLLKYFPQKVMRELAKRGYVMLYQQRFTPKAAKLIAEKVLEKVLSRLKRRGFGVHEIERPGVGDYPSSVMREYDELRDPFDLINIQEALIQAAMKNPKEMKIRDEDLHVRVPKHKSSAAHVIVVDKSGSMRHRHKMIGAIEAALGLEELLRTAYPEDKMRIVAYDDKPRLLKPEELINLFPYGMTDIGLALDFVRTKILAGEEGSKNVFLITDSEPTITCYKGASPVDSALHAARSLGEEDISLNIIMLDRRRELVKLCEKIAKLCGDSTVTFVKDPLNLKEILIKSFVSRRHRLD